MHEVVPLDSTPVLKALFLNDQEEPATPSLIVLTIVAPDGTTLNLDQSDVNVVSPGHVEYPLDADQVGVWTYTFEGTGNGVDASDTDFLVVGVTVHAGPCDDWLMPDDVFACGPCSSILDADRDHAMAARVVTAATEFYWTHSGRQFSGLCDVTVRPCCQHDFCDRPRCGCPDVPMLRLPGPVRGVIQVLEDGAVLSPAAYRVEQYRWLVRLDGGQWRACQDQTADPTTDDHTLQIRYVKGTEPPALGVAAASELACELYRACTSDEDCAIPSRVTNMTRQGVSLQLVQPAELGIDANGNVATGLATGARFLATYPGNKGRARPGIASPDVMPAVRRVS